MRTRVGPADGLEAAMRRMGPGCLLFLCLVFPLEAGIVTNTNDSGAGSVRDVIAAAPPGDTITFSVPLPNTIALTTGEIALTKNLTISGPGAAQLAIGGSDTSRIFNVAPATDVVIEDLTILSGRSMPPTGPGQGGCIVSNGILTLNRVLVSNCLAVGAAEAGLDPSSPGQGGGVAVIAGSLTVSGSTIEINRAIGGERLKAEAAAGHGGGIWISPLAPISLSIADTTFRGNAAIGGTTALPAGCAVGGDGRGGGLAAGGSVTIERSTFDGNTAQGGNASSSDGDRVGGSGVGGGLYQDRGSLTMSNATFSGNTAVGGSVNEIVPESLRSSLGRGGLAARALVGREILCTGTSAGPGAGGGLGLSEVNATLRHLTVAGNSTASGTGPAPTFAGGGGILAFGTTLALGQTIVSGNSAPNAPDLLAVFGPPITSTGYNLIATPPVGGYAADPTDDVGNGTDPLLGPLAPNGGATETRAIAASSPARDAIPPGDCVAAEDQRTILRPQGPGCDIGAFELETSLVEIPTLSQAGLALLAALLALAAGVALRRA